MSQSASSCSRSRRRARAAGRSAASSRCSCTVPARQGMHLPHDSSMQNSMKNRATSTMLVSSSITIMPPEPMIEPSRDERLVVDRRVEELGRDAAAGRPAGLHRLDRARRAGRRRSPRRSGAAACPSAPRPARCCGSCRPGRRPWSPCSSPCRSTANQSAPLRMIGGTLAKVSTLLISVGTAPEALVGRVGRPRPGRAALALDRVPSAPSPRRRRTRRRRCGCRS